VVNKQTILLCVLNQVVQYIAINPPQKMAPSYWVQKMTVILWFHQYDKRLLGIGAIITLLTVIQW